MSACGTSTIRTWGCRCSLLLLLLLLTAHSLPLPPPPPPRIADALLQHLYRWVSSPSSALHHPCLHRALNQLMAKVSREGMPLAGPHTLPPGRSAPTPCALDPAPWLVGPHTLTPCH